MKKWMLILSIMGSLLLFTACSEEAAKKSDKESEPKTTETADAVDNTTTTDDQSEEVATTDSEGESTEEEYTLEDKPEYNQIFKIFLDKKMEDNFRKLVGDDVDIFRVTFQTITPIPTDNNKEYAFHGYMPGLEGVAEGIVVFDEEGHIWAATTEGEKVNFYTNASDITKHNSIIEEWRQSYFSGNEIVYKGEE